MIEKLTVRNFQSWRDITVEFHESLNVFVGTSDSGKTALLRALGWIAFNRPSGEAYRRWGTKETSAELTADGMTVLRSKGKDGNLYSVNGLELTGFGQGVPPNVETAVNLGEINLQKQFDAPFLISLGSGEISRKLNEFAKLEIIDSSFSNAASLIRQNNMELQVAESELQRVAEQLVKYDRLVDMEVELVELETMDETMEEFDESIAKLSTVIQQMDSAELALERIADPGPGLIILGELESISAVIMESTNGFNSLQSIVFAFARNERTLSELPDLEDTNRELETIETSMMAAVKDADGISDLSRLIQSFEFNYGIQQKSAKDLAEQEQKFHDEMPDVCPLCDQEINHG